MRHRYDRYNRYSSNRGWGGFEPYKSMAERAADADRQRAKLLRKGETLQPVALAGFAIAAKWWGKAWCANLERYADYANRIGRGRSYVRHGMVLDLRIAPGAVQALVQGSRPTPYRVNVKIALLAKQARAQVEAACRGQIGSLADLLAGQFPKALEALFTADGSGLFPAPRDIQFDCTCPDWASMCKHVAAVLYGIGARFDEDSGLFFALRGLDPQQLIGGVVKQRTDELLAKAQPASGKVLADADLSAVFGIELATPAAPAAPARPRGRNRPAVALPSPAAAPASACMAAVAGTRQQQLLDVMKTHGKAADALTWVRLTGWRETQVRNTLANLMGKGLVTCPARGRYRA
jgi:uncharacterized Zn finger protein